MAQLIVAIDVGTSGVRAMLFNTTGEVLAKAYKEFESIYPRPSWVEQDAEIWWTTTCSVLHQMLTEASCKGSDIAGVSITNQRETIVPVDENGTPLRNAIVWQDRRTVLQCDWIRDTFTLQKVYEITGLTIDPYFSAPKILWIKENEPNVFRTTYKFLLVHDFIVNKFTGQMVTDFSNASRTMLFDIFKADWSSALLDAFEIPREKLPTPVPSGFVVGEVSETAAKQSGLPAGTPIVAGGGDQQCAALGVGVIKEGMTKATTGTGTFMLAFSDSARLDPKCRLLCSRHVIPDAFVVEASMFTTGSALRWFRDNLAVEECNRAKIEGRDTYDIMTQEANDVPAGAEGIIHIPHFVGAGAPYWNPYARGVFAGLALGHSRAHLIRAILEGVAFELRTNLEVVRSLGLQASEMRVTGGAARSEIWLQIQADVLGIPVIRTKVEEATAMGAAILAATGVSLFKSIKHAVNDMVRITDPIHPSNEHREVYEKCFQRYRQLYKAIANFRWE